MDDSVASGRRAAGIARALKQAAIRWVRPPLIPLLRLLIRYSPFEWVRAFVWKSAVGPYCQYADHPFNAITLFGAAIAGNTRDFIQRCIYYFGVWEPNLTRFVASRLGEGDLFVDVGANIGYFCLLASGIVGRSGKVVAVEASPSIFRMLLDNLRRNGAVNVEAVNVAASDRPGKVTVYRASDYNIGETAIFRADGSRPECEVDARPLDALITPGDMARCRLVKIDVEGAEWLVINGMRALLKRARSDVEIIVEIRPESLEQRGESVEGLLGLFAEHGFHPYRIENDYNILSYTRRSGEKRPERIREPVTTQTDVIFSRTDADWL